MAAAERLRVLLLLPASRLEWHDTFASRLAACHDVVGDGEIAFTIDLSERADAGPGKVLRPLYDGSPDMRALLGRLQRGGCPLIDVAEGGAVIASSYAAIGDSGELDGRLATVLARVEAMLLRALEGRGTTLRDRPERAAVTFSRVRRLASAARRLAARIAAPLRPDARPRHWNLALRWDDTPPDVRNFDLAAYAALPADPGTFHADPFVIARGGRHYLFAEAYPYSAGKGEIVCAEIGPDGMPGPFATVLERPWHLSYPFVFEHGGETYLLPESSSRLGAELFRAADFPSRWELERTLLEGVRLVDPTLFEHDGRLWLFATVPTPGGSDWDELFAWHAPALAGPWTAHARNPIKSDCRSARPGGRPLRIGARLLRPAQRCERAYGEALVWLEITALTPDRFEEVEIAEWRAAGPGVTGPHNADLSSRCRAVDFRSGVAAL